MSSIDGLLKHVNNRYDELAYEIYYKSFEELTDEAKLFIIYKYDENYIYM